MEIDIRPQVSILGVLKHLNYKPWYAIAEFVDNSINSFLANRAELAELGQVCVEVDIEFGPADGGSLVIRDNACGILRADMSRAFRAADVPPDRSQLSEFGMGMKSAACWLANNWSARTSALGEAAEYLISFDVPRIVERKQDAIAVSESPARAQSHYTEIRLWNLNRVPQTKTVSKIREHLSSIYRIFLRDGQLKLRFNGEDLVFEEPEILVTSWYRTPTAPAVRWLKPLHIQLADGRVVTGFAGLRAKASTSGAGFALFRHRRLIVGSADEGYRPPYVFGQANSYRYQRLFGELHLDDFDVSHTKDGFRWEESESELLELLKAALNEDPLQLLTQAEEYRVRSPKNSFVQGANKATAQTAVVVEQHAAPVLAQEAVQPVETTPPPQDLQPSTGTVAARDLELHLHDQTWKVKIEVISDDAVGDWISLAEDENSPTTRQISVRLNVAHPFMDRFCSGDAASIEGFLRVGVGICLGESAARAAGARQAGMVRRNVNDLLRNALAHAV